MRDQEVHGDVLAVYVLIHHIPDGLGHHVGVQVGVVLQKYEHTGEHVSDTAMKPQTDTFGGVFYVFSGGLGVQDLTLWKKAAPVRTMESSQE